jgi:uncharacterized protein (TIGR00251 family)
MTNIVNIKVIPNAKRNEVKRAGSGYKVYLTAPPVEGKANKALLEMLAEEFNIRKSRLHIIKGINSRNKTIRITT